VLYLLAELERAAIRPHGVILYPHPTGVDAINVTTGKRLLTESRSEPDLPLLGPACKAAKAAAEADYRVALAAFRERMAALRRDAEVLPVPPRPPAPRPAPPRIREMAATPARRRRLVIPPRHP
jgi:hypothetical protein